MSMGVIGIIVGVVVVLAITIGIILTRLYKRTTKDEAFVRTGHGGEKVVKDGGAIVIGMFHNVIPVNMKMLKLTVAREREDSLSAACKQKVDVVADFYVRVKPDNEGISAAAQTLGALTMHPEQLKGEIDGKLISALRSVAAGMTLNEMHDNREEFCQRIRSSVTSDLDKNGLELENVAMTRLKPTDIQYMDPNNPLDAEGLTKITEITEDRKKKRNAIEADTRVSIEQKNLEADQKSLEYGREREYAELAQEREIETRRSEQQRELAQTRSNNEKEAQLTAIAAKTATEQADIEREKDVKMAQENTAIELAKKSEERSKANAEAANARSEQVEAEEKVKTVEAVAQAERQKQVAVKKAEEEAETDATAIRVMAAAQKAAAEDRASAMITEAEAEAKKITITAEAKSTDFDVEAAGKRKLNEAENIVSIDVLNTRVRTTLIETMPSIIEQMVKPAEKIDGIKVHMLSGLNGGMGMMSGNNGASQGDGGGLPNQIVDAMAKAKLQNPLIENLGKMIGADSLDVAGLTKALADNAIPSAKDVAALSSANDSDVDVAELAEQYIEADEDFEDEIVDAAGEHYDVDRIVKNAGIQG